MYTNQLVSIVKSDKELKPIFKGVYARDMLPKLEWPSCIILNTDNKSGHGQHWLAIYVDKTGFGNFFDSFGSHPNQFNLTEYITRNCSYWNYSSLQIQGNSSLCGEYCALFLHYRVRNTLRLFYSFFDSNFYFNDIKCKILYDKNF